MANYNDAYLIKLGVVKKFKVLKPTNQVDYYFIADVLFIVDWRSVTLEIMPNSS